MMAYANEFVVCVKVDGKVLRDAKGDGNERNVFLPHGTKYSLLLKNLSNENAAAAISIDGCDALAGERVYVPAGGCISLKRFMLDGNKTNGESFRFVSLSSKDGGITDPSSKDNGLIEVDFYKEEKYQYTIKTTPLTYEWPVLTYPFPYQITSTQHTVYANSPSNQNNVCCRGTGIQDTVSSPMTMTMNTSLVSGEMVPSQKGATVQGESIKQEFSEHSMAVESYPACTIKLRLKVRNNATYSTDNTKQFCQNCGKKINVDWKHCPFCGISID